MQTLYGPRRLSRGVRRCALGSAVLASAAITACDRPTTTQVLPRATRPSAQIAPVADASMGSWSPMAMAVVAGLQDPRIRRSIVAAMKDTGAAGIGIDLQACQPGGKIDSLYAAAEKRGAMAGAALCALATHASGLVLYMDREQLANWDPSVIPIVTALADPSKGVPDHLVGYRSPTRTLDLRTDDKLATPILVVLPMTHPHRTAAMRGVLFPSLVSYPAPPPTQTHRRVP